MTVRKRSLWKVTNNPPILRVRDDVGEFVYNGVTYNEVNLYASLSHFTFSLHDTKSHILHRPESLTGGMDWELYNWLYRPQCVFSLNQQVEKLVALLKSGKLPEKVIVRSDKYASVLV